MSHTIPGLVAYLWSRGVRAGIDHGRIVARPTAGDPVVLRPTASDVLEFLNAE